MLQLLRQSRAALRACAWAAMRSVSFAAAGAMAFCVCLTRLGGRTPAPSATTWTESSVRRGSTNVNGNGIAKTRKRGDDRNRQAHARSSKQTTQINKHNRCSDCEPTPDATPQLESSRCAVASSLSLASLDVSPLRATMTHAPASLPQPTNLPQHRSGSNRLKPTNQQASGVELHTCTTTR